MAADQGAGWAVERAESLPQPIRDKVIERAQSALKQVDAASLAAEAEVKRLEGELWQQENAAPRVRAEADAPTQAICTFSPALGCAS